MSAERASHRVRLAAGVLGAVAGLLGTRRGRSRLVDLLTATTGTWMGAPPAPRRAPEERGAG
jgi:uncharacterized membrane protein